MCYPHTIPFLRKIPPLFYPYHSLVELQKHQLCQFMSYLQSIRLDLPECTTYIHSLHYPASTTSGVRSRIRGSFTMPTLPATPPLSCATTWLGSVPKPSYSTDLRLKKKPLKGRHLYTIDNIKTTSTKLLKGSPIESFQGGCRTWISRWKKCIDAGGTYFEEF